MKTLLRIVFAAALSAPFSAPLLAHHGATGFDERKTVSVRATVENWSWANPHCFLKVKFNDEQGKLTRWLAETGSPQDLTNLGWTRESFKPGDQVTIVMTPSKNGANLGLIEQIVLANGQTLRARRGKGVVRIVP